jgi:hypothetical protein
MEQTMAKAKAAAPEGIKAENLFNDELFGRVRQILVNEPGGAYADPNDLVHRVVTHWVEQVEARQLAERKARFNVT